MTETKGALPDHEKLFDEICGKLHELSHSPKSHENLSERLDNMQVQIRRSQEELNIAQQEIHDKIKNLDTLSFANNDLNRELKRMSEQLEQERMNNSKLSTDLAKSLELNLRLQFEIEEIRSKSYQALTEEKKHNTFLQDKAKTMSHELDLAQALANETRLELAKAKEKFQMENQNWLNEKRVLQMETQDHVASMEEKRLAIQDLHDQLTAKNEEIVKITESLGQYEDHTFKQHDMMKLLSEVAEKKMIELKLALDRKTIESQDYYSHLQQAMTQIHVLRQENGALKDYIAKLTALHQQKASAPEVRA